MIVMWMYEIGEFDGREKSPDLDFEKMEDVMIQKRISVTFNERMIEQIETIRDAHHERTDEKLSYSETINRICKIWLTRFAGYRPETGPLDVEIESTPFNFVYGRLTDGATAQ